MCRVKSSKVHNRRGTGEGTLYSGIFVFELENTYNNLNVEETETSI